MQAEVPAPPASVLLIPLGDRGEILAGLRDALGRSRPVRAALVEGESPGPWLEAALESGVPVIPAGLLGPLRVPAIRALGARLSFLRDPADAGTLRFVLAAHGVGGPGAWGAVLEEGGDGERALPAALDRIAAVRPDLAGWPTLRAELEWGWRCARANEPTEALRRMVARDPSLRELLVADEPGGRRLLGRYLGCWTNWSRSRPGARLFDVDPGEVLVRFGRGEEDPETGDPGGVRLTAVQASGLVPADTDALFWPRSIPGPPPDLEARLGEGMPPLRVYAPPAAIEDLLGLFGASHAVTRLERPRERIPTGRSAREPAAQDRRPVQPLLPGLHGPSGPTPPSPLRLSYSQIDLYRTCPRAWQYRYLDGLPQRPSHALTFGSLVHEVLEAFHGALRRGELLPVEELLDRYRAGWSSWGFPDARTEERYRRDGEAQIRRYWEEHRSPRLPALEVEKHFVAEAGNGVRVEGYIDRIDDLGDGQAEIVDYKTGKPKGQEWADASLQMSVYAWASRRALGLEPGRLTFHFLTTNEKISTVRPPAEDLRTEALIHEVAGRMRGGDTLPLPGRACQWCDYAWFCPDAGTGGF